MPTQDIADRFAALCKDGKFDEAGDSFWDDDVVSIEPMGPNPTVRGRPALLGKRAWWYDNHEVHGSTTEGPYVNGDQFALRFTMDVTAKATGQRFSMQEVAVYTVKDDRVVEERFLFGGMG